MDFIFRSKRQRASETESHESDEASVASWPQGDSDGILFWTRLGIDSGCIDLYNYDCNLKISKAYNSVLLYFWEKQRQLKCHES